MIDTIHKKKALICDNCGDGAEKFESWQDLQDYIRENGWKAKRVDGEWVHYCNVCREGCK